MQGATECRVPPNPHVAAPTAPLHGDLEKSVNQVGIPRLPRY